MTSLFMTESSGDNWSIDCPSLFDGWQCVGPPTIDDRAFSGFWFAPNLD
jgi:hypothetical protein